MNKAYLSLSFIFILLLIILVYIHNEKIIQNNKNLCNLPTSFTNVLQCYEMGSYEGNESFVLEQTLIYAERGDKKAQEFVALFLINKKMNTKNLPLNIAEKYKNK